MAKGGRRRAVAETESDQETVSKTAKTDEQRAEDFRRLASQRVSKAIDGINALRALARNPKAYSFTQEQRDVIFETINNCVSEVATEFDNALAGTVEKRKKQLSFTV